jgi:hypothetical protein
LHGNGSIKVDDNNDDDDDDDSDDDEMIMMIIILPFQKFGDQEKKFRN